MCFGGGGGGGVPYQPPPPKTDQPTMTEDEWMKRYGPKPTEQKQQAGTGLLVQ
jgi:hypothetical protein